MEKVNIGEFRNRMSFYLNNLPIELAKDGQVVATIVPAGSLYKQKGQDVQALVQGHVQGVVQAQTKEEKVAELRELIKPLETKVDTQTGEITQPDQERRRYVEYDEQRGEDIIIEGTFEDFQKRCGKKQRALATWKAAKPLTS